MESAEKKKYGFEGDSHYVAQILGLRLREFLPRSEIKHLCTEMVRIAVLDFNLQGVSKPKKKAVETNTRVLLEYIVPCIYDNIMSDLRNKKQTFVDVDEGELEVFVSGDDHLYHLAGIVEQIENEVRSRYKK